ncbi:antirepressor AbbA, partial [Bacillus sp. HC-Mk]
MQREVVLTKEEESLLLDILFQQNYASEILAVELTDIENGLKQLPFAYTPLLTLASLLLLYKKFN